ncbi:MAG: MBL fold metallo-hydrolase [Planctomycetota bacterium]|nr:MAG: MBL fold metallo-hydrolase [Planctomycetota bacterium]
MELKFYGAACEVTGSCHMLRAAGRTLLLDCGLFQGRRQETYLRNTSFRFPPAQVDAVIQSHAHIDHSGRLPMLVRQGFRGAIHATDATVDLCEVMLLDTANILQKDAQFLNDKRAREQRHGGPRPPPIEPLYDERDVDSTMRCFQRHRYGEWFEAAPGLRFRFHDAGHILGSAWVEAEVQESGRSTRLVFTGDYGRHGIPILRDPVALAPAAVYISESTYGDRMHPPLPDMELALAAALRRLAQRGRGKLLIPAFAIGRTQHLLYAIGRAFERGLAPRLDVVVDSPLAAAATRILLSHCELFDAEARAALTCSASQAHEFVPGVRFTEGVEESKALNRHPGPVVVVSASGMMESGRILHHLAHSIESEDTDILVPGYQAEHTLGRRLLDGAQRINIFGDSKVVRAHVISMPGFSAHADRGDLLAALTPHAERARALFLVHGEDGPRRALAQACAQAGFRRIEQPVPEQGFTL